MSQSRFLNPIELQFHGKSSEYFRIWIVNILLTILTLGIYSAWAKVRNKQYFYGNTTLDGSPFEYTANPVTILKGRLVVVAILAIYTAVVSYYPAAEFAFVLIFIISLPWLIMRGLMFNARYSSYRNLNFAFEKNFGRAVKTILGLGLMVPLSLGLFYPYYMHAIQRYRVDNHSFGQLSFRLLPSIKAFYKYYLLGISILVIGIVVIFFIFRGAMEAIQTIASADPETSPDIPPAITNTLFAIAFLYGILYFFVQAYIRANIFNVVWSNTSLNNASTPASAESSVPIVTFSATLLTWKLFMIYLTNTIAIIVSIGLLIPWTKIRLARYRIDQLTVSSIANLETITAVERKTEGAIGSEMGDILDVDIGL
ncbi:MAG: YjgN family protein [Gammaproteobacteria bacterium]|nr:YjgN family protein [Gammaproteobacteria bacterium]MDH3466095.1 YjgN family protein [Gammaproteobacteria bacterium]